MEDTLILEPMYCLDCGMPVECGLMNWVKHSYVCKHDGPNENIEAHHRQVEHDKATQVENDIWDPIEKRLNEEEAWTWTFFQLRGIPMGDGTYGYGVKLYTEIAEWKESMIKKYRK